MGDILDLVGHRGWRLLELALLQGPSLYTPAYAVARTRRPTQLRSERLQSHSTAREDRDRACRSLSDRIDGRLPDGYHTNGPTCAIARAQMHSETAAKPIGCSDRMYTLRRTSCSAFTLVELLVVISIISVLTATLLPALGRARRQARTVLGMGNLRQITAGVNYFASDHGDRYPPSVATVGFGDHWNWQEPTMLTGYRKRSPQLHRSMSAYMRSYIEDASVFFCPNAPKQYKYLQGAWDDGDEWDNPDTAPVPDPVIGVYCFYWNYTGYLGGRKGLFKGPKGPAGGWGQSRLLVSDYFGYDHWRSPNAYGSCEKFRSADITEGTWISSAYWSCPASDSNTDLDCRQTSLDRLGIELHAGYTDGHVESYCPSDTVTMKVIWKRETNEPYPAGLGPGDFCLPRIGLR